MSRAFEQPLYHGTVEMIPRIDVTRGRFKKDFGRGFYLALQPRQAVGIRSSRKPSNAVGGKMLTHS